jgi:transposase InsO family protein
LPKDWTLKTRIENILHEHPSYGYPRVALALRVNKKRAARMMRLFGIKAYQRRGRKFRKLGVAKQLYPNLLTTTAHRGPIISGSPFTYIPYRDGFLFLATVMDLFTREIVGMAVQSNHAVSLEGLQQVTGQTDLATSVPVALNILATQRATRKILVIGSDFIQDDSQGRFTSAVMRKN